MALDTAMKIALSGLNVASQAFEVISLNIANSSTPDYARRVLTIESTNPDTDTSGVNVVGISRNVDPYWVEEIRAQTSTVSYSATIKNYLEKVQIYQGAPNKDTTFDNTVGTSLNSMMADLMSSLRELTASAETGSLDRKAVYNAEMVSNKISSLAQTYESLRLEAETDLQSSFTTINNTLETIYQLNKTIQFHTDQDEALASLEEERENLLKDLAKQLNINIISNDDNTINIYTASSGRPLLDFNLYQIEYNPLTLVEQLIDDQPFSSATVSVINNSGQQTAVYNLVESGTSSEISAQSNSFKGNLQALLDLRDSILPNYLAQLDLLANTMVDQFNKIHNTGTGFPGFQTIQATEAISLNDTRNYSGIFRMGIVDSEGRSVNYLPDNSGYKRPCFPLDLDLGSLNIGNGAGLIDFQTIINEINEYFFYAPVLSRTELGNIEDIKIAATENLNVAPKGIFNFDFQLSNKSRQNSSFEVLSVNVYDSGNNLVTGALTSTLPSAYTSLSGVRARTSQPITIDLSPSTGSGPYTITTELRVTDSLGNISHSFVNFELNDNPPTPPGLDIMNNRYTAVSALGDAIVHPPVTTQRFALATLVDAEGNQITTNDTPGYLMIQTSEDNYYLSFDDNTSQELGKPVQNTPTYQPAVPATNRGFGHFIGLNNLFVANDPIESSAINMAVTQQILDEPELLSRGRLIRDPNITQNVIMGDTAATGALKFLGIPSPGDIININGQTFTFETIAAGDDQITIGASLPNTINNIIYTLSQVNNYTMTEANKAVYQSNNLDSLMITYQTKGTAGNSFQISANLSVPAQINDSPLSTVPSGTLIGGANVTEQQTFQPWTYGIGEGANSVLNDFADLTFQTFSFQAYGGLETTSASFVDYITVITSYSASETTQAKILHTQQNHFLKAAVDKFEASVGINLDQESSDLIKYQRYYTACAKIIKVAQELYDELFSVF